MQKEYYNVYYYRYSEQRSYAQIESMIAKSGLIDGISIMDLSDKEDDEARCIIGDVIKAEKVREYDGSDNVAMVHLFVDKLGRYILVLSVYESEMSAHCVKRIVEAFDLPISQMQPVSVYGHAKGNAYDSVNYWQKAISSSFEEKFKEYYSPATNYRQVERYTVDDDLKQLLNTITESDPVNTKSIIINSLGWIVANNLKQNKIIMEEIHEGGMLGRIPLLYDNTISVTSQNEKISNQLSNAEKYDMCTYEKIDIFAQRKLSYSTLVSFELIDDKKYDMFLQKAKDYTLYRFCKKEIIVSPLAVCCHIGEKEISFTYDFDYACFEKLSIEDLHKVLCGVMKARILNENIDTKKLIKTNSDSLPAKIRIREVKTKLLRTLSIFERYDDRELADLSDKFEVIHKDSRQEALSQNYKCEKLLFIISGRVEVDGLDSKRFLRPLLMLKAGDVIGVDSLLKNKKSMLLYQVFSEEAVLLSIDVNKFEEECIKHPELMTSLLEVQTERMYKFAKLWMMA